MTLQSEMDRPTRQDCVEIMNKTLIVTAIAFASTLALQPLAANSQSHRPDQYPGRDHGLKIEKRAGKAAWRNGSFKNSFSVKEPLTLASAQLAQGDAADTTGGDKDDNDDDKDDSSSSKGGSSSSPDNSASQSSDSGSATNSGSSSSSGTGDGSSSSPNGSGIGSGNGSSSNGSGMAASNGSSSSDSGSSKPSDAKAEIEHTGPAGAAGEPDDTKVLQDSLTDPKWKLSIEKGQEQLNSGNLNGAVSNFQKALKAAQRLDNNDRILELNYRKLGQAYYQKEDFAKAYDSLSNGMTLCEKLGIRDSLLEDAITKVSPNYKTIEMTIFPDDIIKQMRNAGVQRITAAKQDAGHLITFELADKYTKAIGNDEVTDMGFAKKVSFQFLEKEGESWQISAMKGLTAKAKGMWVNLMATMLSGGGGTPKAEVTAGKMGIQKTVNVDMPNDIYSTARGILMNLSKAIQSPPVFARTGLPRSE